MYVKELDELRYLTLQIESKIRRYEELETALIGLKGVDYSVERVQTSPSQGNQDELIDKLDNLKKEVGACVDKLIKHKEKTISYIDKLDPLESVVLQLRYVNGLSWLEISEKTHYTLPWLYQVRNRAVDNFIKIRDEEEKKAK